MHEMSIAQNILEIIQEEMGKNHDKPAQLKEVGIQVGELVAVVPESLEFCFNILVENTDWSAARLKIEVLPVTGMCQNCQQQFSIQNFSFICPLCNSVNITIIQGQELKIRHLEVE